MKHCIAYVGMIGVMLLGWQAPAQAQSSAALTSGCSGVASATVRTCYWQIRPQAAAGTPQGLTPAQLRKAYGATGSGSARLAIVDAYGDRNLAADLTAYAKAFGLSAPQACTRAAQTGCYEQTNQRGAATMPASNQGWAEETALDVEAAYAVCPGCRLTVVATDTASTANLLAGVDRAVQSGAAFVSMSWGGPESRTQLTWDKHFAVAGVTFVASSGDDGYGVSWPASAPGVVAVGGTSLRLSSNGSRQSETAWSGSGSGCSAVEAKPAWQHDTGCSRRTVADLAAVADPATGAAIYTTAGGGWITVGGTSLAAPVVTALAALAGVSNTTALAQAVYTTAASHWHDVTIGQNGSCSPAYLCTAISGYDGPTGRGSLLDLAALAIR